MVVRIDVFERKMLLNQIDIHSLFYMPSIN